MLNNDNTVKKRPTRNIWVVGYFEVKRHSRILYVPLDPLTVKIHGIDKGDILKVFLVKLIKPSEMGANK